MSATLQLYILCYNRAELARQAIQSALAQTDKRFQLVISDNSTDGQTKAMVAAEFPQVEYRLRDPHLNVQDHLNLCLSEVTADHVCLFHDDDLLRANFVARVLDLIAAQPSCAAIGVNAWIAEEGQPQRLSFRAWGDAYPIRDARQLAIRYFGRYQLGIAPFPGYVYAKASLAGLRFDATEGKYADVSWLLRVVERGPMAWVVEPLMIYRLHASNDSRSESIADRLRLLADFKSREPVLGSGVIEDFRFFVYKKALELDRNGALRLQPLRRQTMSRYLRCYRCRRLLRMDQYWALLTRTAIRLLLRSPERGA